MPSGRDSHRALRSTSAAPTDHETLCRPGATWCRPGSPPTRCTPRNHGLREWLKEQQSACVMAVGAGLDARFCRDAGRPSSDPYAQNRLAVRGHAQYRHSRDAARTRHSAPGDLPAATPGDRCPRSSRTHVARYGASSISRRSIDGRAELADLAHLRSPVTRCCHT